MNLYLLTRNDDVAYDEFDSFVVVAESEEAAKVMLPAWGHMEPGYLPIDHYWTTPDNVKVMHIGVAESGLVSGQVIIASFNAG